MYKRKTDAELETLAWDLIGGRVFGSWNVNNSQDIQMVFMVTIFLDQEQIDQLKQDDVVHLYEYIDKASPRSVNGMPSFFSAHYIDKNDFEILRRKYSELLEIKKARTE